MPMLPHQPTEPARSRVRLSRRGLGAVAGLGMLALAGAVVALTPAERVAGGLMASSSALAAETSAPPAVAMPSFADLVERLKPSVVSVYVDAEIGNVGQSLGRGQQGEEFQGQNPFGPGSPFEFFFRQFGNGQGMPAQRVRAQGSGFFISADGYVLTNNHVVEHAKKVQIKTTEGQTLDAKVVGADAKTDLAVLKVDGSGNFPFVKFASTSPRVGDWVLAMGNPFGLGGTVTAGIVSASGRDIGSGPYDDYLQIDAPVNKGNSGGPTFNTQGEVIGVNTAIYSPSGGSIGIAFDIPAETAKAVAQQLKSKGSVSRGWIGVMVQPVTADIADSLGLKDAKGALIDDVQQGGPAAKAGLKSGDLVVAVGNDEIKDARELARKIASVDPGKQLALQVRRDGGEQTITVTTAAFPNDQAKLARQDRREHGSEAGDTKLGLYLAPAKDVEGAGSQGVVVVNVDPSGLAADKGLQQGDIILDAGGKMVSTPNDVSTAVNDARKAGKHTILMRVKSAEATRYVALPLA
jgi:serine protease Do